ncbi:regulation of nuclear pre-mRNA domain-containing protein 1B [Morus notabilis]|uniref:regulation of nuclear pre-mRNA domain-containing protein 1B n=1 Tax=Morus notabilis TaxID=981085 RepID=UPI000CECEFC0|nr:regulation of nuclear pre-mRNA domain-containing protein 1B [Morus notabilis]XP_024031121.1 regulation of nuclear pre-mRNA domain-containing protein 1B [Morus notabilis]
MSNEAFDGQSLAEKLSKLNNSQQSIESLSKWCVSHRKRAKQIVETWEKCFNSSQREKRISLLYLANDILQNSRRKGSEFVNEFWKVLPAALKHVYENGDEHGKKVATRLVDIWEERKVFGSRGQSLKDEMLAKNPPALSALQVVKSSNPIKIVKRDAHSLRIKLAVGGPPEKIITAFQSVLDEYHNEEAALNKCSTALQNVRKIEDVENTSIQGNQLGSGFLDEQQEHESILNQCIGQLESAEATRLSLVSQLKEALQDQELKLDNIRTQLQVARLYIEQASNVRKRFTLSPAPSASNAINPTTETTKAVEQNQPVVPPSSTQSQALAQPVASFAPVKTTDEESKKAAAAAVAARLAASTSSAQMLTSVLSSLVAEEAASMNGGLTSAGLTSGLPMFSPEKRQKLEKSMPSSDVGNSDVGSAGYFTLSQQSISTVALAPLTGLQSMPQGSQMQSTFAQPLPPPPPPLQSPTTPSNQYVQSPGLMAGVMPFGYGSNTRPPPPLLPPHFAMGLARPNHQQQQQSQLQLSPQQQQQPQLQPANGGFYRPPGIGFYGQNHQPATPPVHRQ